jgi:type I restriction enzyme S subunit
MKLKTGWLKDINPAWEVVPGNFLFSERSGKSYPDDTHLTPSQTYGVLPQQEYIDMTGNRVVLNLTGADNMKHVEKDDFIIHLRSFQGGIEHSNYAGKVSNAYCVLIPNKQVNPKYFRWVLKSSGFIQELSSTTDQLRDGQSIKFNEFRGIGFPLPPLPEQGIIASVLDSKMNAILQSISAVENLHLKLKELRDSLCNSWFQFGNEIDPSSLGDLALPPTWQRVPLGRLGTRVSQDGNPHLEPLSVYLNIGVIPRSSREDNKNQLGSDMSKYQRVEAGDLIFNKLRTWQGGFGIAKQTGIVSPAYYVFRFEKDYINPDFVDLLLKSPLYLAAITRFTKWMPPSQFDTSWDDLKNLPVIFPSITEQNEIMNKSEILDRIKIVENKLRMIIVSYEKLGRSLVTTTVTEGLMTEAKRGDF